MNKLFYYLNLIALNFLLFCFNTLNSQVISNQIVNNKVTTIPNMVTNLAVNVNKTEFLNWFKTTYFSNPVWSLNQVEFKEYFHEKDNFGVEHTKYYQYVNGIKVHNGVLYVHERNNIVTCFNGECYNSISPDKVNISANNLNELLSQVKSETYLWNNLDAEIELKKEKNDINATYYPKAQIEYVADGNGVLHLTNQFLIASEKPYFLDLFGIKLNDNKILYREPQLVHADTQSSGKTFYRSSQNFVCKYNSSTTKFELAQEVKRKIKTWDGSVGTKFESSTLNWTDSTIASAYDVHWGAEKVYDWWKSKINYKGINGKDSILESIVSFGGSGNAFWSLNDNNATFLASLSGGDPCTSLDVVGHEFGHGILDEAAGLVYTGASCALHEGMADINGNITEYLTNPSKLNWAIGEEPWSPNGIRNMKNPLSFSNPNYYNGTNFGGGCHNDGQVAANWFYKIVMGDTGVNEKGYSFKIPRMGWNRAIDVHYQAVKYYMTPSTNYPSYYAQSITAGLDIFGTCNDSLRWLNEAWKAVGLEDTSVKIVNLTHGFTNNMYTRECVKTVPNAIVFNSIGDKNSVRTFYWPNNTTTKSFNTSYTFGSVITNQPIYLKTEICSNVFWDTCYVTISLKPKAVISPFNAKSCKLAKFTVANNSLKTDTSQTLGYEWYTFPYFNKGSNATFTINPEYVGEEILAHAVYNIPNSYCRDSVTTKFEVFDNIKPNFTVKNVCPNTTASFKNTSDTTSLSKVVKFYWDLGKLPLVQSFNASTSFTDSGEYTIKLISQVLSCSDSVSKKIKVFEKPISNFTYFGNCKNSNLGLVQNIKFNKIALNNFQWDLGSIRPYNLDTAKVNTGNLDSIKIKLTVQNNSGCIDVKEKIIPLVNVNAKILTTGTCINDSLKATIDMDNNSLFKKVEWNYYGNKTTKPKAVYLITNTANTEIQANLQTTNGCELTLSKTLQLYTNPNVAFSFANGCSNSIISFSNGSNNVDSTNFTWDFGDGNFSNGINPKNTYNTNKTKQYNVSLTAKQTNCNSKLVKPITIYELPTCGFSIKDNTQGGLFKDFIPDSANYTSYEWDFGNGKKSVLTSPTHQYDNQNTYSVTLKQVTSFGCECSLTKSIFMKNLSAKNSIFNNSKVYPNPANSELNVSLPVVNSNAKLEIIDILGKTIASYTTNSNLISLPIQNLSNGTYLLKISNASNQKIVVWIKN